MWGHMIELQQDALNFVHGMAFGFAGTFVIFLFIRESIKTINSDAEYQTSKNKNRDEPKL